LLYNFYDFSKFSFPIFVFVSFFVLIFISFINTNIAALFIFQKMLLKNVKRIRCELQSLASYSPRRLLKSIASNVRRPGEKKKE